MTPPEQGNELQIQGEVGENELRRLATEAGLTAVPAVPDRKGWDFCIEGARPSGPTSLDRRPSEFRYMVQVKTVRQGDSAVPITLANWERMVKQLDPWFVLVVVVEARTARKDYLVHVGKFWIAKVLERLRRMSAKPEPQWEHRTMGLKWRPEDEIVPRHGGAFLSALQRHAVLDPQHYAEEKKNVLHTVGYDAPPYRGNFRLASGFGVEALADFAVGLRTDISIENVTIEHVRFGIPLREAELSTGTLSGGPPRSSGTTVVTAKAPDGTRCRIEFETRRARAAIPELPENVERVVLYHPNLQLVAKAGVPNVDLTFNLGDGSSPSDLDVVGPAAELVRLLILHGDRVRLDVQLGDAAPATMKYAIRSAVPDSEEVRAVADAWAVSRRLSVVPRTFRIKEAVAQRSGLALARAALDGLEGAQAEFAPTQSGRLDPGRAAMIGYAVVRFDTTACAVVLTATGTPTEGTDDRGVRIIRLAAVSIRSRGVEVMPVSEYRARGSTVVRRMCDDAAKSVEQEGVPNIMMPDRFPMGGGTDDVE